MKIELVLVLLLILHFAILSSVLLVTSKALLLPLSFLAGLPRKEFQLWMETFLVLFLSLMFDYKVFVVCC